MAKSKKTNTAFTKIVAEAKRIRKAHPAMKWTNAIKDAAKHIKSGAKTVVKKASAAKKKVVSVKKVAKKRVHHVKQAFGIGNIKSEKNAIALKEIERNLNLIKIAERQIEQEKLRIKNEHSKINKIILRRNVDELKSMIIDFKKTISSLKKHIK